ncbi:MAG TPA: hypothetical protein VLZ81_04850, partial [Blastocatellia bacterium]|nr:hypothetical protein [Blastocatellia bacterium]
NGEFALGLARPAGGQSFWSPKTTIGGDSQGAAVTPLGNSGGPASVVFHGVFEPSRFLTTLAAAPNI